MSAIELTTISTAATESGPAASVQPVRIAYVVHGLQAGGIERSVTHLVNGLDQEKFKPIIICLDKSGPAADWIEGDDTPIIELHKKPGYDWTLTRRLAQALREHEIDIVQSHNWGTLLESVFACRKASISMHIHAERGTVLGVVEARGIRFRLRALAMRWALKRVDLVLSNAKSVAERIQKRCGFPAENVHIIPNGVDRPHVDNPDEARREIRQKLNISEKAFVAGSVGRLHPVKGFDTAIDVIPLLRESGIEAHLILVGDGPERAKLTSRAKRLGVSEYVHLVGHRDDLGRWLAAMDVYINTSHSEGMSQSLIEAMSMGLPLVATDVGDNATVVGRGNISCGFILPDNEASTLADTLSRLVGNRELQTNCHFQSLDRHRLQFTYRHMIESFQSLYEKNSYETQISKPRALLNLHNDSSAKQARNSISS